MIKKQNGYTLASLSFFLFIFGFALLLLFKIGPLYLNHYKIASVLESVKNTKDIQDVPVSDIRMTIFKQFNMNSVDNVDIDEDLIVSDKDGVLTLELEHHPTVNVIGNVSATVTFHDIYTTEK